MPSVATLAVSVTARINNFIKGFKRVARRLKRFTRSVASVAKRVLRLSVALTGLAVAAAFAFQRIARAGEQFNQKMRRSLAIMSGVSADLRAEMKETALDVARVTKASAEQAAESYFFLASAGLDAKQSIAALPLVAQFAQAGMFDMARATDLLTDAQSALGLTVKGAQRNMLNMKHVGDVLVKANTLANASVEQFSESLTNKAGAALKILGKDIEEGVAVLAAFADQGVKSSDAGTALNIVLRELSTKAIKNAKAFKRFGVTVFDVSGEMRNIAHIIADIEDALRGQSDEVKKATLLQLGFSDKSVIFLQTLIGLSRRIAEYESALRRAGGTMKSVADKQLTPFEEAIAKIRSAWTELSDTMEPAVTAISFGIEAISKKLKIMVGHLGPEAIKEFLISALNMFDVFFRGVDLKLRRFILEVSTVAEAFLIPLMFFGGKEFDKSVREFSQRVKTMKMMVSRQEQFLAAVKVFDPAAIAQLLGTRVGLAIEEPQKKEMAALREERRRNFKEAILAGFDKIKFELQRAPLTPVLAIIRAITSKSGLGGAVKQLTAGLGTIAPSRFAQVSLSRQAISGLTAGRGRVMTVKDQTLADLVMETNRILRRSPGARTVP